MKEDVADRCADFIGDMVELCRKHKVLMSLSDDLLLGAFPDPAAFEEQQSGPDGTCFIVGVSDIELVLREKLWDEFHAEGSSEADE